MIIVCQNKMQIVRNFNAIYMGDMGCGDNTIYASLVTGRGGSYILGEYGSIGRCQEVFREIVNAYKDGLPVFEMPRE